MSASSSNQSPQRKSPNTLGLFTSFVSDANTRQQWAGMVTLARQRQVNLVTYAGGVFQEPAHAKANGLYDLARQGRCDGLVIWSGNMLSGVDAEKASEFVAKHRSGPVVSCEKVIPGAAASLLLDDSQGMRQAVRHLIEEHGRRRIAFLRGPSMHWGSEERYKGYREALVDASILFDPKLVSDPLEIRNFGEKEVAAILDGLNLTPGVDYDAIVCANSSIALLALDVLQKRGISLPEHVSLVGFDDFPKNVVYSPGLTAVYAPFYEMGQRAGSILLDLLEGRSLDPVMTQSVRLILRQSCGCLEKLVVGAALPEGTRQPTVVAGGLAALAAKKESWIANITQAFLANADTGVFHAVAADLSGEIRYLVDAFLAEATGKAQGVFLKTLRKLLYQTSQTGGSVPAWQAVISSLRQFLLPYLDQKTLPLCENLWNQGRVMIGDAAERAQIGRMIANEKVVAWQRQIGNRLIAANDVAEMMSSLAEALPVSGIPGCYVALFSQPDNPIGLAKLVLAYAQGKNYPLPSDGVEFLASALIPEPYYPDGRVVSLLVEPLYFKDVALGFVVFEVDELLPQLYEDLRQQLSSALYKVQLVQSELADRLRAEEDLRYEQHLFQSLMDTLPDVIYFKDSQSRFIRVNPAMAQYHGLAEVSEMLGKTDFDLFDEAHARPAYEDEQRIMATGEPLLNVEEKEIFADGRIQWVSTTKMPLRDVNEHIVGTFGISRDITSRKQAEQQVERRSVQLQTAAEVARAAGSILDPSELVQQVVNLIRERFDLYYVGLFLVDATGEWTDDPDRWAVLRAGTGEAAEQMLAQGHKLEISDTSMIGWCISHQQPRITLDVGKDAVRFRNPLLPLTHSELALPLISRGQTLGGLSIQSSVSEAFAPEDIIIFQVMADQLANAISNARLYESAQQALQEMQAYHRRYVRQGWELYTSDRSNLGYRQTETGLQPMGRSTLPEVRQAINEKRNLILEGDASTLVVPILLRNQPIGAIGFHSDHPNRHWTQDELNMIEVITEQFALAAENLRLIDETQRRADRERLTANITSRMRETLSVETILRTAVQEVQQALNLSEVVVRLKAPEQQTIRPAVEPVEEAKNED